MYSRNARTILKKVLCIKIVSIKNSKDINTTVAFDDIKYAIHNQHIYITGQQPKEQKQNKSIIF